MCVRVYLDWAGLSDEHGYVGQGGKLACPKCYQQSKPGPGRRVSWRAEVCVRGKGSAPRPIASDQLLCDEKPD